MTGQQAIDQYECRWQPTTDLAPVAGSAERDYIQSWHERLRKSIRPALPGTGVPKASVRYQIFPDSTASLAWRQWSEDAIPMQDDTERRPLVARILVGDARVLTPEVAAVISRRGMSAVTGSRPGQVPFGTRLPAIDPGRLLALADEMTAQLDQEAVAEQRLSSVIAAALADLGTALCVQLPEADMELPPERGPQALLLWGLCWTIGPLMGGSGFAGRRGWSFSTYEPPLGGANASSLPDIVFRTDTQEEQQPLSTRREVTVRPRGPGKTRGPYDDLADTLVSAYRHMGGKGLAQNLVTIALNYPEIGARLKAAYGSLLTATPGLGTAPRRPIPAEVPPSATPDAPLVPSLAAPPSAPAGRSSPVPPSGAVGAPPGPDQSAVPAASRSAPPEIAEPAGPAARPLAPAGLAADTRPSPERRDELDRPVPAPGICVLLDRLGLGPGDPGFPAARRSLVALPGVPPAADRAAARKLMPERGWYLLGLSTAERREMAETLEAIFRLTVVPDLAVPEVAEELVQWAYELSAPVPVIIALSDAARRRGDRERVLMEQALCPALGQRWMAERGIDASAPLGVMEIPPRPRRPAYPASDPNLVLRLVTNPVIILLTLVVFCGLLITVLLYEIPR